MAMTYDLLVSRFQISNFFVDFPKRNESIDIRHIHYIRTYIKHPREKKNTMSSMLFVLYVCVYLFIGIISLCLT